MSIKAVLFDLDGTLLPMDQDVFTKGYFKLLTNKAVSRHYKPQEFMNALVQGITAMVHNDGTQNNETVFWQTFSQIYGKDAENDKPFFEEFYQVEFQQAQSFCRSNPLAAKAVRVIKDSGFRLALATNPLFPSVAVEIRIRWAGLEPQDFEFFTTYETSGFCKPNPKYFLEVADRIGLSPAECLVVGNDTTDDMVAQTIGMHVFLLTDCLINAEDKNISDYPSGDFNQLLDYVSGLNADTAHL